MLTLDKSIFQKRYFVPTIAGVLALAVLLTISLDALEARAEHFSFYFSESLLFSSYWWLFLPLLYMQLFIVKTSLKRWRIALSIFIPLILHLLTYPAIVYIFSALFYDHTYHYWPTFQFGLVSGFIKLLLLYSLPLAFYLLYKTRFSFHPAQNNTAQSAAPPVTSFIVTGTGNEKLSIATSDILYFSANPPYIDIHHISKKYLHKATLKSIAEQTDGNMFVRIHKSIIVNTGKVTSYRSRQNGDYDLVLTDGTELRVSRNFAADFKTRFQQLHQVTAE